MRTNYERHHWFEPIAIWIVFLVAFMLLSLLKQHADKF